MEKRESLSLAVFIRKLGRPVFTTHELVSISGRSASTVVQCLGRLARQGLLFKVCRGVWADPSTGALSPFVVLPHLFPRQRVYVSFITALHLHGIVEQIPKIVTLASTGHSRTLNTRAGVFSVHQLTPAFFSGFDWYKGEGRFLIAGPEKALIDALYLSGRRKKQYGHFPELHFSQGFSFKKAGEWVARIPEQKVRRYVQKKLEAIRASYAPGSTKKA